MNNVLDYFSDYGIKQTGHNKYLCRCPSHNDKSPSLAITVLPDKTLVHCFAGCDPESIMASIGLTVNDLFEDDGKEFRKEKALRFKRDEFMSDYRLIQLGESDLRKGKKFTQHDKRVFSQAIDRVNQYKFNAHEAYKKLVLQDAMEAGLSKSYYDWLDNDSKYLKELP